MKRDIRRLAAGSNELLDGQVDQEQHLLSMAGVQQAERRAATWDCSHSQRLVELAAEPCKGRAT